MALSMGSRPRSARPESTAWATARYDEQPTGANATPRAAAYASRTACEYEPSIPSKAAVRVRIGEAGSAAAGLDVLMGALRKQKSPSRRRGALAVGVRGDSLRQRPTAPT